MFTFNLDDLLESSNDVEELLVVVVAIVTAFKETVFSEEFDVFLVVVEIPGCHLLT